MHTTHRHIACPLIVNCRAARAGGLDHDSLNIEAKVRQSPPPGGDLVPLTAPAPEPATAALRALPWCPRFASRAD